MQVDARSMMRASGRWLATFLSLLPHGYHEQGNQGHGRLETRKVWVTDEVKWLGPELLALWPGLANVAVVERTRPNLGDMTGKVSIERGYYITSRKGRRFLCSLNPDYPLKRLPQ